MPKYSDMSKISWPLRDTNGEFVLREEERDLQKRKPTHRCDACHKHFSACVREKENVEVRHSFRVVFKLSDMTYL